MQLFEWKKRYKVHLSLFWYATTATATEKTHFHHHFQSIYYLNFFFILVKSDFLPYYSICYDASVQWMCLVFLLLLLGFDTVLQSAAVSHSQRRHASALHKICCWMHYIHNSDSTTVQVQYIELHILHCSVAANGWLNVAAVWHGRHWVWFMHCNTNAHLHRSPQFSPQQLQIQWKRIKFRLMFVKL